MRGGRKDDDQRSRIEQKEVEEKEMIDSRESETRTTFASRARDRVAVQNIYVIQLRASANAITLS